MILFLLILDIGLVYSRIYVLSKPQHLFLSPLYGFLSFSPLFIYFFSPLFGVQFFLSSYRFFLVQVVFIH